MEDTAGENGQGPNETRLQGKTGSNGAAVQPENCEFFRHNDIATTHLSTFPQCVCIDDYSV